MAQIHIQRKRRPFWPWIIGLVAGALLIWLLLRTLGEQNDPGEVEPINTQTNNHAPAANDAS